MTRWTDALKAAWDELALVAPIKRQYRSKVIAIDVPLEIRAGMRAPDNAPCLLLRANVAANALFELGGMRLGIVPNDHAPLLVLSLEDSGRRDLFTTICADVVASAAEADPASGAALSQFLARLDAWRKFLRDRSSGLSRQETVGLIGELLVLEQLVSHSAGCLATWQAPLDGLHDFVCNGHALEVKTGLGPARMIQISKLDQLDTSGVRRLDLLHVRLIESPMGRSLFDIVSDVSAILRDEQSRREFENLLLRRGLLPSDDVAHSTPKVQARSVDAYNVRESFPRLLRASVPLAISEVMYNIEIRGIAEFSQDTASTLQAFKIGSGHA